MSGSPTQKAKGGGKQQEAQTSAKPAHAVQQPSAQHSEQTDGCPGTHQTRYDCNTVSAIANVRQADAAEWFNHAAVLEIGVGLVTAAAAFFAAKFARDAVTAARDTLTHEKRRSRSDLRPWITYVHHDMGNLRPGDKIDGKPVDRGLWFAMKFVNSGKTPAISMVVFFDHRVTTFDAPRPIFEVTGTTEDKGGMLGPNVPRSTVIRTEGPQAFDDLFARRSCLWLYCHMTYEEPGHEGEPYETEITIRVEYQGLRREDNVMVPNFVGLHKGPQNRLT